MKYLLIAIPDDAREELHILEENASDLGCHYKVFNTLDKLEESLESSDLRDSLEQDTEFHDE